MPRPVLLSRTLDPILGILTGGLAFYLHESNPRTAPPQGHTIKELVNWKLEQRRQRPQKHDSDADAHIKVILGSGDDTGFKQ